MEAVVESPHAVDVSLQPLRSAVPISSPSIVIRPTSREELEHLANESRVASVEHVWSSIPDLDYQDMMEQMEESRIVQQQQRPSSGGSNATYQSRPGSGERVGSAASVRSRKSRPGSGGSMTRGRAALADDARSSTNILMAAKAQDLIASSVLMRPASPPSASPHSATLDVPSSVGSVSGSHRPQSVTYLASLRPATSASSSSQHSHTVLKKRPPPVLYPSRATSALSGGVRPGTSSSGKPAPHRSLPSAPISLLQNFEERVRCSKTYTPLEGSVAAALSVASNLDMSYPFLTTIPSHSPPTATSASSGTHQGHYSSQLATGSVRSPPRVLSPPLVVTNDGEHIARADPLPHDSSAHDNTLSFHEREPYVADILDDFSELEYFTFEKQRVDTIRRAAQRQKEMLVQVRQDQEFISKFKRSVLHEQVVFWKRHRPPTSKDMDRLMPGRGNCTRSIVTLVGRLGDGEDPKVEGRWTSDEERNRFAAFMRGK